MRTTRVSAGLSIAFGFAGGLVAAVLAIVLIRWIDPFQTGPRIDSSRPSVVRQVRQLQRLETVVFGIDKIISGGYENRFLPRALAGDRILLIVYGDVTAGIDLARLDASSVSVDGRDVRLTLPPAEVFSTRIDNGRTRVYSRETGIFSRVDPDLESDVRKAAEHDVRQAALDDGILQTATANAVATLKSFLQGLGFEHVDVRAAPLPTS